MPISGWLFSAHQRAATQQELAKVRAGLALAQYKDQSLTTEQCGEAHAALERRYLNALIQYRLIHWCYFGTGWAGVAIVYLWFPDMHRVAVGGCIALAGFIASTWVADLPNWRYWSSRCYRPLLGSLLLLAGVILWVAVTFLALYAHVAGAYAIGWHVHEVAGMIAFWLPPVPWIVGSIIAAIHGDARPLLAVVGFCAGGIVARKLTRCGRFYLGWSVGNVRRALLGLWISGRNLGGRRTRRDRPTTR